MKTVITILISFLTLQVYGQNTEKVELRWKIDKGEKLVYSTVMTEIDTSIVEVNFGDLFKALSDSTENGFKESKELFRKLNQDLINQDYITTLSNKGNSVIDIVMSTKPKELSNSNRDSNETDIIKQMQSMNQGVMLRGSVYETGGIHSFWVKSNQENLISLLFELPGRPVHIGDKWSLNIDLIANDQNFECDSSYKINEVTLADIKKINGETIAVVKYNIAEYVKGKFNAPSFMNDDSGQKETMMKFTHQGIAEFSMDKGRWVSYDGIMGLEATGIMTANKKTQLTLVNASK